MHSKPRRHRMATHLKLAVSLLSCLGLACGSKSNNSDSSSKSSGQAGMGVTPTQKPGLVGAAAGMPCEKDSDCGNGTCLLEFPGSGLLGQASTPAPGGYCTGTCRISADCGENGQCVQDTTGGFFGSAGSGDQVGSCYAACTSNDDCRDGYRCLNLFGQPIGASSSSGGFGSTSGTCQASPPTDHLTGDVVGSTCSTDDDCQGGRCQTSDGFMTNYPDGYCTGSCLEDADCGDVGVCNPGFGGAAGTCYRTCTTDTDCGRDGYRCRTSATTGSMQCLPGAPPLPDGVVGMACTSDDDCGGGAMTCAAQTGGGMTARTLPGGYCTQRCVDDSDCGTGGTCVGGFGGGGSIAGGTCYKVCQGATDCRDGYSCTTASNGFGNANAAQSVCLPTPPQSGEDAGVP